MAKLLLLSDILESTFYTVGKNESIVDVALKVKVAPAQLISDNALSGEPSCGRMLIVERYGKAEMLLPDDIFTAERADKLRKSNDLPYFFPFQIVTRF